MMNEMSLDDEIQRKLADAEAKMQAVTLRKQQLLTGISTEQRFVFEMDLFFDNI